MGSKLTGKPKSMLAGRDCALHSPFNEKHLPVCLRRISIGLSGLL